jgi:hypothetical protein
MAVPWVFAFVAAACDASWLAIDAAEASAAPTAVSISATSSVSKFAHASTNWSFLVFIILNVSFGRLDVVRELLKVRVAVALLGLWAKGDDAFDAAEKSCVVEDHLGEFLHSADLACVVRCRGEALDVGALLAEVLGRHGLALEAVEPGGEVVAGWEESRVSRRWEGRMGLGGGRGERKSRCGMCAPRAGW